MEETTSIFENIDTIVKLITIIAMVVSMMYPHISKTPKRVDEMKLLNFTIGMCGVSVITSLFALAIFSMFLWVLYGFMWYFSKRLRENHYDNIDRRKNGELTESIGIVEAFEDLKDGFKNIKW